MICQRPLIWKASVFFWNTVFLYNSHVCWFLSSLKSLPSLPDILTKLINASLQSGLFPCITSTACTGDASPQEATVGSTVLNNNRPISKLSFVSKLLERVVRSPAIDHISQLSWSRPSSPVCIPSTPLNRNCTAEDLQRRVDGGRQRYGNVSRATGLFCSFDIVDHSIMLQILEKRCDLSGSTLQWHATYLQSRTCAVIAGGVSSDTVQLECSLPQGSSFGSLKFVILRCRTSRTHQSTWYVCNGIFKPSPTE